MEVNGVTEPGFVLSPAKALSVVKLMRGIAWYRDEAAMYAGNPSCVGSKPLLFIDEFTSVRVNPKRESSTRVGENMCTSSSNPPRMSVWLNCPVARSRNVSEDVCVYELWCMSKKSLLRFVKLTSVRPIQEAKLLMAGVATT